MPEKNGDRSQGVQPVENNVSPLLTEDLVELSRLAEIVIREAGRLRLLNKEKHLGISVPTDNLVGAASNMEVVIRRLISKGKGTSI